MNAEVIQKKYPAGTPEVMKMLGLGADSNEAAHGEHTPVSADDLPVANLPVAAAPAASTEHPHSTDSSHSPTSALEPQGHQSRQSTALKIARTVVPYILVFAVGIFLYYFFFSSVDFSSIFKAPSTAVSAPQETALQQLEQQNLASYNTWINSYYFDVSDPTILAPNTDNSGDGLSNFQKYLLNLNPKAYDSLGLGMADSQAISDGINPLTGSPLTDAQKAIINQYIDMEAVMNRLALSNLQHSGQVAGAAVVAPTTTQPSVNSAANVNTSSNYNNNNNNASSSNNNLSGGSGVQIQSNGAVISDPTLDHSVDVNTAVPGLLQIPDLKISAPIIWSQSPDDFETDLQSGVIHYPGTAMPGQIGTTYIAGHSSNYVWAKGDYNHVFTHLGDLALNSSFQITVTDKSGKKTIYHYVVIKSQQYSPTDQAQFQNSGQSIVALSTCWPVGSTAKRLVLFGELTQVEQ